MKTMSDAKKILIEIKKKNFEVEETIYNKRRCQENNLFIF